MKTVKRYFATEDLTGDLENNDFCLSRTINGELENCAGRDGQLVELYEVTFKLIKKGFVSVTTNVKLIKE